MMRFNLLSVRHSRRVRQCFIAMMLSTTIVGCGSSEDEMIRRAAMRRRQPDSDEETEAQTTTPSVPTAVANAAPANPATPNALSPVAPPANSPSAAGCQHLAQHLAQLGRNERSGHDTCRWASCDAGRCRSGRV